MERGRIEDEFVFTGDEEKLGTIHPDMPIKMNKLGRLYVVQGVYDEVEKV